MTAMRPLATWALLAFVVAGCAAPAAPPSDDLAGVTDDGQACFGVRGVVVDDAIRPIAGALVELVNGNTTLTLGDDGTFTLPCLPAGSYILRASHPLYNSIQITFEVDPEHEPPSLRIQLTRVIFATPYSQLQAFDGYLVCSVGFFVYASEECGEGVGVPCEVPLLGCQRVGGQSNNHAQWDFWLDGGFVRTLVIDMTWTSSSPTFDDAFLVLATDWTCDPFCIGNELNITTGGDPLYLTDTITNGTTTANTGEVAITAETRFSTFVWPDWGHGDATNADVAFNQKFQVFATAFYYLPAPAGWSFLDGEPAPF